MPGMGRRRATAKKDRYQQRQVQYRQKPYLEKNLEKDSEQRNTNGNRPAKPMYLYFLARG